MFLEPIQTKETFEASWQSYLALISAITALLAVIVGPIASYFTAVKQIKLATKEAERKEWLQSLRTDISALHASINSFVVKYGPERKPESFHTVADAIQIFNQQAANIWIRLDRENPDQKQLADKLMDLLKMFTDSGGLLHDDEVAIIFLLTDDLINITGRITISELRKK